MVEVKKSLSYQTILENSTKNLVKLIDQKLHLIELGKPDNEIEAIGLSRVVSKLSPIIGNLLEYEVASKLNSLGNLPKNTKWLRQDPGFPDTVLDGFKGITPGIEIKTWFPLATEITARFRETQTNLTNNNIHVAVISWLPEKILFGQPKIIGVWTDNSLSVAKSRDNHYHQPPSYVVLEPGDTSSRTKNLQQTNCLGYKFQGNDKELINATNDIQTILKNNIKYSTDNEYQKQLKELTSKYEYRLDTNFAKIDRIEHKSLEDFKQKILKKKIHGKTIETWSKKLSNGDRETIKEILEL
jgi:hypothetical protein